MLFPILLFEASSARRRLFLLLSFIPEVQKSIESMSALLRSLEPTLSAYKDRRFFTDNRGQPNGRSVEEYEFALRTSTTVYVGNLSFHTTEEQIWETFSLAGDIRSLHMGLDRNSKTPCGFCFVVYHTRDDAEACVRLLTGAMIDDRSVRADFDWGFEEGRQWGRGRHGGQVRDEWRDNFDAARGGYGKQRQFSGGLTSPPMPTAGDAKRRRMSGGGSFQRNRNDGYGGAQQHAPPQQEDADKRMRTGEEEEEN